MNAAPAPRGSEGPPRGGPFSLCLALAFAAAIATSAGAQTDGAQTDGHAVTLHARDGSSVEIGRLTLTAPSGGVSRFARAIDGAVFRAFFLSTRECKCMPAPAARPQKRMRAPTTTARGAPGATNSASRSSPR